MLTWFRSREPAGLRGGSAPLWPRPLRGHRGGQRRHIHKIRQSRRQCYIRVWWGCGLVVAGRLFAADADPGGEEGQSEEHGSPSSVHPTSIRVFSFSRLWSETRASHTPGALTAGPPHRPAKYAHRHVSYATTTAKSFVGKSTLPTTHNSRLLYGSSKVKATGREQPRGKVKLLQHKQQVNAPGCGERPQVS